MALTVYSYQHISRQNGCWGIYCVCKGWHYCFFKQLIAIFWRYSISLKWKWSVLLYSKPEQIETSSLSDLCSKSLPCSLIRYSLHDKTSIVYSIGSCTEFFDTLAALHGVAVLRNFKPVAASKHVSFFKHLWVLALRKKTVAYPNELGRVITFWGSWCMWAYIKITGAEILTHMTPVVFVALYES